MVRESTGIGGKKSDLFAGIATNLIFRALVSVCSRLDSQADQVTGGSTAGEARGHLEGLEAHP